MIGWRFQVGQSLSESVRVSLTLPEAQAGLGCRGSAGTADLEAAAVATAAALALTETVKHPSRGGHCSRGGHVSRGLGVSRFQSAAPADDP